MTRHEYHVYIIASRSRTLYIGVTGHLLRRIWQHKEGVYEGFSKDYHCNRLVYVESHGTIASAVTREKQLKRWRREKKIWLIEQQNLTWEDLSADWYGKEISSADGQ